MFLTTALSRYLVEFLNSVVLFTVLDHRQMGIKNRISVLFDFREVFAVMLEAQTSLTKFIILV